MRNKGLSTNYSRTSPQPLLAAFLVTSVALAVQLVLLPLVSRELNSANAFLGLLVVVSLKQKQGSGVIWGAVLGGISDLLMMQHVGYHGVSFTLIGYAVGWLGGKMVISGFVSLCLLTALVVAVDAALVTILFALIEQAPAISTIGPPLLLSAIVTPLLAAGLEAIYTRIHPKERP